MSIPRKQIRWNGWGWAAHQDVWAGRDDIWRWLAGELGMPALLATPARPLEELTLPPPRLDAQQIAGFAKIAGAGQLHQDDYERAFHARGRSYSDLLRLRAGDLSSAPDAVIYPRGEDEVVAILKLAAQEKIAVVPFGGGTSMVGGVTARPGAITLDLSGMERVIAIDSLSGTATAEAGIYGPALERALAAKNLTLGHFPQSFEFSSLGGWIAHHGAGQESGRFGRAADWLIGARLATAQGILETGDRPASAAGPELRQMLLGSEGTLGIITQATVRVRPLQPLVMRAFLFRDFASGSAAIREALQAEIPHRMLRLSDAGETSFLRAFAALENPPGFKRRLENMLLAGRQFDAHSAGLVAGFSDADSAKRFAALAKKLDAVSLGEGPAREWPEQRFHTPYLQGPLLDRGVGVDMLESSASWRALPALYAGVKTALEYAMREAAPKPGAHGIVLGHLGHAQAEGASLHFTCLFPRILDGDIAQAQAIRRAGCDAIIAHGGTISHHHGVGEDHLPWMQQEKGVLGIAALRGLKNALDPEGIMNPGKLLP